MEGEQARSSLDPRNPKHRGHRGHTEFYRDGVLRRRGSTATRFYRDEVLRRRAKIRAVGGQPPPTASLVDAWTALTAQGREAHVSKPHSRGVPVSLRTLQIARGRRGSTRRKLQQLPLTSRSVLPWEGPSRRPQRLGSPQRAVAHEGNPSSNSPSRTAGKQPAPSNRSSALQTSHVCAGQHFA